jgi:hypothetical protein
VPCGQLARQGCESGALAVAAIQVGFVRKFADFADSADCGLGGAQDGFANDESLAEILNKATLAAFLACEAAVRRGPE